MLAHALEDLAVRPGSSVSVTLAVHHTNDAIDQEGEHAGGHQNVTITLARQS